jgi:branched-chain amino acid transport system substrate-binding protein
VGKSARPDFNRPRTRDIVQNIYIRRIEKLDGEPWAIELDTIEGVKDPLKEAAEQ